MDAPVIGGGLLRIKLLKIASNRRKNVVINIQEILADGGISLLVLMTLVQIAPVKINPWSWRGYTHWTMMVLAAVLCVPLDVANEHMPWELPLIVQAILGGLAITAGELLAGLVLNVWLGMGIWDYSGQWGNLWGQICPLYTALWCLLAGPVIVAFDWLDYWLCGGERPKYKLI